MALRKARRRARVLGAAGVLASLLLAGCAAPPELRLLRAEQTGAVTPGAPTLRPPQFSQLTLAGQVLDVEWHLPASAVTGASPQAWLLLQHGFTRRCANLRGTAARVAAAAPVATLCLNADMAGGNPALAQALAAWLAGPDAVAPDGSPRPPRLIVGGHSAGALFAARVGAALIDQPGNTPLAGALLLDAVGGESLSRALVAISDGGRRPVLAVMAPPLRCNAKQLGLRALRAVRADALARGAPSPLLGVELARGTHVDPEAEDTDAVAVRACGNGWPQAAEIGALRALLQRWAGDLAAGQAPAAPQTVIGPRVPWQLIE
jgi:hypothetical protein